MAGSCNRSNREFVTIKLGRMITTPVAYGQKDSSSTHDEEEESRTLKPNLLSPSLIQRPTNYALHFGLHSTSIALSLTAITLLIVIIPQWNRNLIHATGLIQGDWTDGILLAPLLASLLMSAFILKRLTTSRQRTRKHFLTLSPRPHELSSRLSDPSSRCVDPVYLILFSGTLLLVFILCIILSGFTTLTHAFVPAPSPTGEVECEMANILTRNCLPFLYTLGELQIAALSASSLTTCCWTVILTLSILDWKHRHTKEKSVQWQSRHRNNGPSKRIELNSGLVIRPQERYRSSSVKFVETVAGSANLQSQRSVPARNLSQGNYTTPVCIGSPPNSVMSNYFPMSPHTPLGYNESVSPGSGNIQHTSNTTQAFEPSPSRVVQTHLPLNFPCPPSHSQPSALDPVTSPVPEPSWPLLPQAPSPTLQTSHSPSERTHNVPLSSSLLVSQIAPATAPTTALIPRQIVSENTNSGRWEAFASPERDPDAPISSEVSRALRFSFKVPTSTTAPSSTPDFPLSNVIQQSQKSQHSQHSPTGAPVPLRKLMPPIQIPTSPHRPPATPPPSRELPPIPISGLKSRSKSKEVVQIFMESSTKDQHMFSPGPSPDPSPDPSPQTAVAVKPGSLLPEKGIRMQ